MKREVSSIIKFPKTSKESKSPKYSKLHKPAAFSETPELSIGREPMTLVDNVGYIPTVLVNAATIIQKNMETPDLFQMQGSLEKVDYLIHVLSRKRLTMPRNISIHDVAELVKVYLTRFSSSVIPDAIMAFLVETQRKGLPVDYAQIVENYREMAPDMVPSVHFVLQLLNRVSQQSHVNGMDTRKLATIFVLDILKPLSTVENNEDYEKNRLRRVQKLPYNIIAMELLIKNVHVFDPVQWLDETEELQPATNQQTECQHKEEPVKDIVVTAESLPAKPAVAVPPSPARKQREGGASPSSYKHNLKTEASSAPVDTTKQYCKHFYHRSAQRSVFNRKDMLQPKTGSKKTSPIRQTSPPRGIRQRGKTSAPGLTYGAKSRSSPRQQTPRERDSTGVLVKPRNAKKTLKRFRTTKDAKLKKTSKLLTNLMDNCGMFLSCEELQPWSGGVSESDDASVMVRTIKNPQTFKFLDAHKMKNLGQMLQPIRSLSVPPVSPVPVKNFPKVKGTRSPKEGTRSHDFHSVTQKSPKVAQGFLKLSENNANNGHHNESPLMAATHRASNRRVGWSSNNKIQQPHSDSIPTMFSHSPPFGKTLNQKPNDVQSKTKLGHLPKWVGCLLLQSCFVTVVMVVVAYIYNEDQEV